MYLKVRSRNHSANQLRRKIVVTEPTVFRLGSQTPNSQIFKPRDLLRPIYEINTVAGCQISNDKDQMKQCFDAYQVPTAKWQNCYDYHTEPQDLHFPLIIKHIHSSRGNGIFYIAEQVDWEQWRDNHFDQLPNYIIEEYKTYSREYRLHVDKFGCFLTHRKMLRSDATERWQRHHSNTVWIVETNPLFDKPSNWDEIVQACQLAIHSVGLDIGCVDVKVQNATHEQPKFIILETNSAPALGEETAQLYLVELKKFINEQI